MKGWPLWETDPALPKRLKPGDWAIAFGLAWLGPAVIGAPLLMGTGYLIEAAGIDVLEVGMIGILLIYSPLFSWLGLLPGSLLLRLALRRGIGGWAMALIIGLALGWGLAGMLGPLAWIMGSLESLIFWIGLRWRLRRRLRPAGGIDEDPGN